MVSAALLLSATLTPACRWDRDTLAEEAKGQGLEVLKTIVGHFDRNPALYYRMRLERVAREIIEKPGDLNLYDDAGVACDHLGDFDAAIAWMEKKSKAMAKGKPTAADRYRYHANLGTFFAHRWFANKADLTEPQDLDRGIDHIKKAIAINPEAHFGREVYQLALMEWTRTRTIGSDQEFIGAPITEYLLDKGLLDWSEADKAVEGFTGLIRLGNAWESVDVFAALADALMHQSNGTLGEAALSRVIELQEQGKRSITGWKFENKSFFEGRPMGHEQEQAQSEFKRLRREADVWHANRTDFMMAKLQRGQHPDTDVDFWSGFDAGSIEVKSIPFYKRTGFLMDAPIFCVGFVVLALTICGVWVVVRVVRART
jgi:tetratricopeptide (TPR) repeat protein